MTIRWGSPTAEKHPLFPGYERKVAQIGGKPASGNYPATPTNRCLQKPGRPVFRRRRRPTPSQPRPQRAPTTHPPTTTRPTRNASHQRSWSPTGSGGPRRVCTGRRAGCRRYRSLPRRYPSPHGALHRAAPALPHSPRHPNNRTHWVGHTVVVQPDAADVRGGHGKSPHDVTELPSCPRVDTSGARRTFIECLLRV